MTANAIGVSGVVLCSDYGLSSGPHLLTLNLTGIGTYTPASGVPNRLWIDEINYNPTSSVAMDKVPAFKYSSGWEPYSVSPSIETTRQTNASVTFPFEGVSVAYYSSSIDDNSTVAINATYSIDGQPPVSFSIIDNSSAPLFNVAGLSGGQHTLTVTNQGNSTTMALVLFYLIVKNTLSTSSSTTSSVSSTSPGKPPSVSAPSGSGLPSTSSRSPSATGSNGSHKLNYVGAIVGAVIGVIALAILCIIFFLRHRKRAASRNRISIFDAELWYSDYPSIPPSVPRPFPLQSTQGLGQQSPQVDMPRRTQNTVKPIPFLQQQYQRTITSIKARGRGGGTQAPTAQQRALGPASPPIQSSSMRKVPARQNRPPSEIVVTHEDSGLRLPQPEQEAPEHESPPPRIVELPPTYTP
ncbi:hypothetical protein BDZ97DRAFT_1786656 [Flammula alnicola]|nr:hypothetical protein BDZ97DRAFT_1786656 [Flammula alnicola]